VRLPIIQHEQTIHLKRKAPLFGCTVCLCWVAGSVSRYVGISNKVVMLFSMLFLYTGQLAMAICFSLKKSVVSQFKFFQSCFYKGQLAYGYMP
jgi:hypothetical protein